MDEERRQLGPRDYLAVLQRRKWLIIQAFVIIVATVVVGTFLQKPIYRATVSLLVETRTPGYARYGELPAFAEVLEPIAARSVETQKKLIISRVVLMETVQRAAPQMRVNALVGATTVGTFRDTDVLEISVEHENPQMAQTLANTLAQVYVEQNQQWNKEATRTAGSFIEERLEAVRQELAKSEEALRAYKQTHGIVDLDEESKVHIKILGDLEGVRANTEAEIRPLQAQLGVINEALSEEEKVLVSSTDIERSPIVTQLQSRLAELEGQRAAELASHGEEWPALKKISAEIDGVRQQLTNEVSTIVARETKSVNQLHQDFVAKATDAAAGLLAAKARVTGLTGAIQRHEAALNSVPSEQVELARLTRAVSVDESVYKTLLEKLHEVRITEAMRLANARIVDPALLPEHAAKPRKALNLALAVLFGLVVGLMLAALAEYFDDTLKTPDEIKERVGVPVLGHVPLIKDETGPYIANLSQRSQAVESYRMLRSNLGFTAVDDPFKTVLVTSPLPAEGKSVTVANLGTAFALEGKRVVVVDADLRHPNLHHVFGIGREPGLTNVLVGDVPLSEALRSTDSDGVRVLTSGPIAPNPAELLGTEKARKLFESLKEEADVILFDSPPLLVASDAAILATELDGVLLVCDSNTVRERSAVQAKELLEKAKARILGIALNKIRFEREGYYYYYRYYYPYYSRADAKETDRKKAVRGRRKR